MLLLLKYTIYHVNIINAKFQSSLRDEFTSYVYLQGSFLFVLWQLVSSLLSLHNLIQSITIQYYRYSNLTSY